MSGTATELRVLRNRMDTIIQVFIEAWFDYPQDKRDELDYVLENDGGVTPVRWIKDRHGFTIAEVLLKEGTYRTMWVTSMDDLLAINSAIDEMALEPDVVLDVGEPLEETV